MKQDEITIATGVNCSQTALFEPNDKMTDYETSANLSYMDLLSVYRGLNTVSEFYDVNAAISVTAVGICAAALGQTAEDAIKAIIDADPIDYMASTTVLSKEVDSDIAKLLKEAHLIVAPSFTKNAKEYLDRHEVRYVTIKTPLKDYKKYLSNETKITPLGTLTQAPNLSELSKDSFKVVTKTKPTTEQVEDAVFAWKVAKHANSHAIVIAKDLKTTAIAQGLQSAMIEYALDYSCEKSKDAILASDSGLTLHDINAAAQGRIALIIVPFASKEMIAAADKYNIALITTGFTNILL